VGADLGAEAVLERGDDAPAVGVVLGVGAGDHEHVQRQPQHVAADLDVALLHHVEHRDLDALGEVGQLVDRDDAAVAARDQPEVDGLGVAQRPALRDLHRVDVADQVGDAGVGGRQLLGVALGAVPPRHPQVVAVRRRGRLRGVGDRLVGVLAELGAGDHRRPLVEQPDQRAQQAGLALAALAEQDHVVPGDQGALELGDDGVLEAVQPRPRVAALAQRVEEVVAHLLAQRLLDMAGGAQLSDRADGGCGHGSTLLTPPTSGVGLRFGRDTRSGCPGAVLATTSGVSTVNVGSAGSLLCTGWSSSSRVRAGRGRRTTRAAVGCTAADYVFRTWHPRTRPADLAPDPALTWTGLTVLDAGPDWVEFVASYERAGVPGALHERSRFERRGGRWVYVDGVVG